MDIINWQLQYNDIDRNIRINVEPSDDTTTIRYDIGLLQNDGTYLVVDAINYPDRYKDIPYVPGTYSLRRVCSEVLDWVPGKYINNGDTIIIYGNLRDIASHIAWNDEITPRKVYLVPINTCMHVDVMKEMRKTTTDKNGSFVIGGEKDQYYKLWIPDFDYNVSFKTPNDLTSIINIVSIPSYRG